MGLYVCMFPHQAATAQLPTCLDQQSVDFSSKRTAVPSAHKFNDRDRVHYKYFYNLILT